MKDLELKSDLILWKQFQDGDRQAYEIVFRRHYTTLYNYGLRITKDVNFTEDRVQDFFVYLIEKRKNLQSLDRIAPYLFVSFRRYLFRQLKMNRTKFIDELETDIQYTDDDFAVPGVSEEVAVALRRRINLLTSSQREALYLRFYNELALEEIAEIMQINYQSVANILYRALKKIRSDKQFLKIISRTAALTLLFQPLLWVLSG